MSRRKRRLESYQPFGDLRADNMKVVHSDEHLAHHPNQVFLGGRMESCHEVPARTAAVAEMLAARELGPIIAPSDFGQAPVAAVHDAEYLEFLSTVWSEWRAAGRDTDVMKSDGPSPDMRRAQVPRALDGKVGYYSFDTCAPIGEGTWRAAYASAQSALSAQDIVRQGDRAALALCRPPGHHAGRDYCGGFCFLNNAAIAAQAFVDAGASRVAILDVDFHHGNGTQSIFYERSDVFVASLHGEPRDHYPFYSGFADERGAGTGEGFNLNIPMPAGTTGYVWLRALAAVCRAITDVSPDAIVISLGVDTFEKDPISSFKLTSDHFTRLGARLAKLNRPTVFVMEGGYALDDIGLNVTNTLIGFEQGS
jgi:acetoin utilization deacetylase AcuC-like enzyme